MAARKAASRRASSRKKATGKKRKVSRKKTSAKKKPVARKKSVAKKSSKKKAKKKASRKKTAARKKVSKKKVAKKPASRKKAARKKPSKKKVAKKQPARKSPGKKKVAKKVSKKKAAARSVAPRKKVPVRAAKSRAKRSDVLAGPNHGIEPYTVRRGEEYMSEGQLKHFHKILDSWKNELMSEVDRTVHHMQDEAACFPDPNDRATQESEFGLELRTRDRERKLIRKISSALNRIDDGSYGYCDETGEEIGLKRLEARPVATLSLEAQERREMSERQFRDRDDRYR
jgi:RNA polymerase-binding transcription factor